VASLSTTGFTRQLTAWPLFCIHSPWVLPSTLRVFRSRPNSSQKPLALAYCCQSRIYLLLVLRSASDAMQPQKKQPLFHFYFQLHCSLYHLLRTFIPPISFFACMLLRWRHIFVFFPSHALNASFVGKRVDRCIYEILQLPLSHLIVMRSTHTPRTVLANFIYPRNGT
jgi:hypothetical protein